MNNFEKREGGEAYEREFLWNNDLKNIDTAQALTEEKLKELGWPEEEADAFASGVREAMMNAIVHGNLNVSKRDGEDDFHERIKAAQEQEKNRAKHVKAYFRFSKDDATAQIKDEGNYLPPEDIGDPTDGERLLQGSGRGLYLIFNGADNVTFSEGEIVIYKQRKDRENPVV
jgi:anti-sigma regulatory factor (Ser/Thr protein kinase)